MRLAADGGLRAGRRCAAVLVLRRAYRARARSLAVGD